MNRTCPPCDGQCNQGRCCPNDERPSIDLWRDVGVSLGRSGNAYQAIVAFICGVLTCALVVALVARLAL